MVVGVYLFFEYFRTDSWLFHNTIGLIAIFVLIMGVIIAIPIIKKEIKKNKYLKSPLSEIDKMFGEEFEEYLKYHFEKLGYKAKTTPRSNDYGADLILTKDGDKIVVQAKRWNEPVGNTAVQEVVAAKAYYKANKAMVVTNSYFTSNARNLAAVNNVELWDRGNIVKNLEIDNK
ncbi:MAG: restriction endonuclease [Lachnospiraceae bacterium]|nr:restriction endonuclease [Lachnospiraceae bacterium]